MKTLAELREEVELGLLIYSATNHDVAVRRETANPYHEISNRRGDHAWYILYRNCDLTPAESEHDVDHEMGGGDIGRAYYSFDALLADWPSITSRPVWGTIKTPERLAYEQTEREREERNKALDDHFESFFDADLL